MNNKKVLVVDDDPAMLHLLSKYLLGCGYEVLTAANGPEAIQIAGTDAPPIIITDWAMPEMDGIELCRALRAHEGIRFAYIIVVTAHSNTERLSQAFEMGADDFLSKPICKPELLARIRVGEHIFQLEEDLAKRTREIHRLNAQMAVTNDKLAEANDKLQQMATTDELTGLYNRREAMSRLKQLWDSADRYDHTLSCVMLDIDHFKRFNDAHGHAIGDKVLKKTAAVLRSNVRSTDSVCRIGGEEFLVLCPNIGLQGAVVCAEHLRSAVEQHEVEVRGKRLNVTISLGAAERRPDMAKPDDVLKQADDALYASKEAGRNRVTAAGAKDEAVRSAP
ncbi:MAG: diguanylate cyclase [Planctomycetota bacterium]